MQDSDPVMVPLRQTEKRALKKQKQDAFIRSVVEHVIESGSFAKGVESDLGYSSSNASTLLSRLRWSFPLADEAYRYAIAAHAVSEINEEQFAALELLAWQSVAGFVDQSYHPFIPMVAQPAAPAFRASKQLGAH